MLRAFDCPAVRTLYQDPSYGLRQFVDIADPSTVTRRSTTPTTAVQALDRLHGIAARHCTTVPTQSGFYVDSSGVCRLIVPVPRWDPVFGLAFTEICLYGADAPQIRASSRLSSMT